MSDGGSSKDANPCSLSSEAAELSLSLCLRWYPLEKTETGTLLRGAATKLLSSLFPRPVSLSIITENQDKRSRSLSVPSVEPRT